MIQRGHAPYLDCSSVSGLSLLSPTGMKPYLYGDRSSGKQASIAKQCHAAERFRGGSAGKVLAQVLRFCSRNHLRLKPLNKPCVTNLHQQLIAAHMQANPDLRRLLLVAPGLCIKASEPRAAKHLKLLWAYKQTQLAALHAAGISEQSIAEAFYRHDQASQRENAGQPTDWRLGKAA